uniref:NADH-ubiquinone oxidoreductase chain 1 n=1 Tax=Pomphorhynchus rocci TaxID=1183240 RepID=A0A806GX42_9BILA|nr:NADH dehydrogenase subunit 1 [Pomphorhynchus rocci]AFJ54217.1 NADH dehydrogenase subunit 1 [Pomphorhynchus rocci]
MLLVLVLLGYFTLLEQKTLGYGQVRKEPNKGVILGLAQPLLDGFKLFMKGFKGSSWASWFVFFVIPGVGLVGVLFLWLMIFELLGVWSVGGSILIIIVVGAFITLFFFITGYMSGCGYGELGAMRTLAQALTYEGVLVFSILMLLVLSCSFEYDLWVLLVCYYWVDCCSDGEETDSYSFCSGGVWVSFSFSYSDGWFSFTILFLIEYGLMSFSILLFGGVGSMSGGGSSGISSYSYFESITFEKSIAQTYLSTPTTLWLGDGVGLEVFISSCVFLECCLSCR